ncbi:MAG: DMT family transporter [Bacillota bacterium]|nr:DMT family transporter [Bacillota bacterium]
MKKQGLGYIYLINTVLFFSTYEAVSKTLVNKIDPFQINFIRFLVGGLILFIYIIFTDRIGISKKDFIQVVIIGVINVVISMNLLQMSLYMTNSKASVIAVIFSSNPIFVSIFSAIIDKEKITVQKLWGLILGLIGILVIFFEKLDFSGMDYLSPLLALLSAAFYGLYTVIGRRVSLRIGSLKMNSYSSIAGSMVLLPFLVVFKLPILKFDYSGMLQVVYLSIFVTGLAYLSYFKGLSITGASSGSLVFFIKPALASILALIFLHEQLTVNLIFGTFLIIGGILISIYWYEIHEKLCQIFGGLFKKT